MALRVQFFVVAVIVGNPPLVVTSLVWQAPREVPVMPGIGPRDGSQPVTPAQYMQYCVLLLQYLYLQSMVVAVEAEVEVVVKRPS